MDLDTLIAQWSGKAPPGFVRAAVIRRKAPRCSQPRCKRPCAVTPSATTAGASAVTDRTPSRSRRVDSGRRASAPERSQTPPTTRRGLSKATGTVGAAHALQAATAGTPLVRMATSTLSATSPTKVEQIPGGLPPSRRHPCRFDEHKGSASTEPATMQNVPVRLPLSLLKNLINQE